MCKPTDRLAGGTPTGRTHPMIIRVSESTFTSLRKLGVPATVAGETLDKIFGKSLDTVRESP